MKINILGTNIDKITQKQAIDKIGEFLNSQNQHQIITANPEIVLTATADENYRQIINNSSLVLADGIGLIWAAKYLSLKSDSWVTSAVQLLVSLFSLIIAPEYCREVLPERIAGVNFMEKICEHSAANNKSIYLLGGRGEVAKKTAEVLKNNYINLNIAGTDSGPDYLDEADNYAKQEIIGKINAAKPDVLFVAFGAPKQEKFINEFLKEMPSVKLAMGVGGSFDFISGNVKRAPQIYQDLGLEWLHRFINEPWRATRIFNATIKFVMSVIRFKRVVNK